MVQLKEYTEYSLHYTLREVCFGLQKDLLHLVWTQWICFILFEHSGSASSCLNTVYLLHLVWTQLIQHIYALLIGHVMYATTHIIINKTTIKNNVVNVNKC